MRLIGLIGFLLTLPAVIPAQGPGSHASGTEVVMILDASGSMRRTDPNGTRHRAAQLFARLLGDENRVGIVEFADSPRVLTPLTPLESEASRDHVLSSVERVGSDGLFTDITAALEQGLRCFDLDVARPRCVVLLTDGDIDIEGGEEANAQSLVRLETEVLAAYERNRIPVHTIAFSRDAQIQVLRDVAEISQGQAHLVTDPDNLHQVFMDIFEAVDQPQMLPIVGDMVMIDGSIRDVTFLLTHVGGDDEEVVLTAPSGAQHTAASAANTPEVRWLQTPEFDLATIEGPEAGEWRITPVGEGDRVIIVTDLALETSPMARQHGAGTPLSIQAWLSDAGDLLEEEQILSNVGFELAVTDDQGRRRAIAMSDDGASDDMDPQDHIFGGSGDLCPLPGQYRITVLARGATFARQRTFLVTAYEDWLSVATDPLVALPDGEIVVQASVLPGAPAVQTLSLSALVTGPDGEVTETPMPPVGEGDFAALFRQTSREGTYNTRVHAEGRWADGAPIDFTTRPALFEISMSSPAAPQLPPVEGPTPAPEPSPEPDEQPEPDQPEASQSQTEATAQPEGEPSDMETAEEDAQPLFSNLILWGIPIAVVLLAVLIAAGMMVRRRGQARAKMDQEIESIAQSVGESVDEKTSDDAETDERKREKKSDEEKRAEKQTELAPDQVDEDGVLSQDDLNKLFEQVGTDGIPSLDPDPEDLPPDHDITPEPAPEPKASKPAPTPEPPREPEPEPEPIPEEPELTQEELDALFATGPKAASEEVAPPPVAKPEEEKPAPPVAESKPAPSETEPTDDDVDLDKLFKTPPPDDDEGTDAKVEENLDDVELTAEELNALFEQATADQLSGDDPSTEVEAEEDKRE